MEDAPKGSVPNVGDRVQIWWPHDQAFYPGCVAAFNQQDGTHFIKYDDGETEYLDMKNERWRKFNDDANPNAAANVKDEPSTQDNNPPPPTPTTGATTTAASPGADAPPPPPPTAVPKSKSQPKPSPPQPQPPAPPQVPTVKSKSQPMPQTQPQPQVQGPVTKTSSQDPAPGSTAPDAKSSPAAPVAPTPTPAAAPAPSVVPSPALAKSQVLRATAPATAPAGKPTGAAGAPAHSSKLKRVSNGKSGGNHFKVPRPAPTVATARPTATAMGTGIGNGLNKRSAPSSGSSPVGATATVTAGTTAATGTAARSNLMNVPKKKMRTELVTAPSSGINKVRMQQQQQMHVAAQTSAQARVQSQAPAPTQSQAPAQGASNVRVIPPPLPPAPPTTIVVKHKLTNPPPLPARNSQAQSQAVTLGATPMTGVTMVRAPGQQRQAQAQAQQQSQQLARRNGTPLERVLNEHISEVVKVQRGVTTLHSMYRDLMKHIRVEDGEGVRRSNLLQAEVESMRSDLRRLMDGQHDLHAQIGLIHERLDSLTPRTATASGAAAGGGYTQRNVQNNQGYRVGYGGQQSGTGGGGGAVVVSNNCRYGTEYERGYDDRHNQPSGAGRPIPGRRLSADHVPQSETIVAKAKSDALNLAARQVMIWLLETDHECRVNDTLSWAQTETTKCMERVAFLLSKFTEYDHALRVLTDSLGVEAANLLWFTDTPSADNLRLARMNYDVWDPPPTDSEWVAEIKLLVEVERRFKHALHKIEVNINDSHLQVTINVANAATSPVPQQVVVRGRPNGNHQAIVTRAPPEPPRIPPPRNPAPAQAAAPAPAPVTTPFRQVVVNSTETRPQPVVRPVPARAVPVPAQAPQRVVVQAPMRQVQQPRPNPPAPAPQRSQATLASATADKAGM